MSDAERDDYVDEYRSDLMLIHAAMEVIGSIDIPGRLSEINRADAVGPILNPTLYREKMGAMKEDAEVFRAARPLWEMAKKREGTRPTPAERRSPEERP